VNDPTTTGSVPPAIGGTVTPFPLAVGNLTVHSQAAGDAAPAVTSALETMCPCRGNRVSTRAYGLE
jgi:hypothetical protein